MGTWNEMPLSWVRVAAFAVVIAYADGFVATSLRGAVGAIQRIQNPFDYWTRTSTFMLPLYVLAVIGSLQVARWWLARRGRPLAKLAAAVLIVGLTTSLGIALIASSSIKDYRIQVEQLSSKHSMRTISAASSTGVTRTDSASGTGSTASCDTLCAAENATRAVHVKAVKLGTLVLLSMNAVLVAFLMVLLGDRLWQRPSPVGPGSTPIEPPAPRPRG